MLMWKCDVCSKTGESPTSEAQFRLKPKGWRERIGTVLIGKSRVEVAVHVCSAACAKRYDRAEAEEVGYPWYETEPSLMSGRPVRPLKVK